MMDFDADGTLEDYLADDEPELSDPKYRFKERVHSLMQHHNISRREAEGMVTTVIFTKETNKRCGCGEVAQYVVRGTIYCYNCNPEKDKLQ